MGKTNLRTTTDAYFEFLLKSFRWNRSIYYCAFVLQWLTLLTRRDNYTGATVLYNRESNSMWVWEKYFLVYPSIYLIRYGVFQNECPGILILIFWLVLLLNLFVLQYPGNSLITLYLIYVIACITCCCCFVCTRVVFSMWYCYMMRPASMLHYINILSR